jgi:hypothetical protein
MSRLIFSKQPAAQVNSKVVKKGAYLVPIYIHVPESLLFRGTRRIDGLWEIDFTDPPSRNATHLWVGSCNQWNSRSQAESWCASKVEATSGSDTEDEKPNSLLIIYRSWLQ